MLRTEYWERDLAEHEVWLPNWRRHQAKAGAVRALERGSRLRIPRRRASPMLKSSWASASTRRMISRFSVPDWIEIMISPKCTPTCPSGVVINIKKRSHLGHQGDPCLMSHTLLGCLVHLDDHSWSQGNWWVFCCRQELEELPSYKDAVVTVWVLSTT